MSSHPTVIARDIPLFQEKGDVAYHPEKHMLVYTYTTGEGAEYGESEVLSTTLDAYGLTAPAGHAWIKDWSEHTGLAHQLARVGVGRIVQTELAVAFEQHAHLLQVENTSPRSFEAVMAEASLTSTTNTSGVTP